MAKMIKCKGCGAEIYRGAKTCPQCGKKNKKHTGLIFFGVCIALIIIISITNKIKSNNEKKITYNWPTSGIAALLPEPEKEYGKISRESKDYFSAYIYFVSQNEFYDYVSECKNTGFTIDYSGSDSYYFADDEAGNGLSLSYDKDDKTMSIRISAVAKKEDTETERDTKVNTDAIVDAETKTGTENTTENLDNTPVDTKEQTDNSDVEANNIDFRKWVDQYEEFMNKYVEFIENYDSSDINALMQYSQLMAEYADFITATEILDEGDYSVSDWAYYTAVQLRILEKMSRIQGR